MPLSQAQTKVRKISGVIQTTVLLVASLRYPRKFVPVIDAAWHFTNSVK
ncbi:Uncharacterised protein [Bifidobacterium longum]|uniref:Uncharacterized protein n=1 Tax=Bifidobacterium longum TaxID=216816 RepID=A0A6N2V0J3_BIFLN